MKINSVMKHCRPETTLAEAAALMRENNCGVLAVVAGSNKAVGIITDSDIAMALETQEKHAIEIFVKDAMFGSPFVGSPQDIQTAVKIMCRERIHRLHAFNQLDG